MEVLPIPAGQFRDAPEAMVLTIRPLTPERWPDIEAIFNAKGCSIARRC